ncbi:MAG: hypothetical protein IJ456_09075 [Bacteroides sp.]|nr:hypothetical protein [Bacteroides sp.]
MMTTDQNTIFEKYSYRKEEWNAIPLTVPLLKELGFVVPRRPLSDDDTPHVKIYPVVNRMVVGKWLRIFPRIRRCRPFFFTHVNNKMTFIVYDPLPKKIKTLQELYDYIK